MNSITKDIICIGVNDYTSDLFENHYPIPDGVTYNSYIILDEKIMVVATTEKDFTEEWMEHVSAVLAGRQPDYLLIQHMEPDHSSAIRVFMDQYPDAVLVASRPALNMVANYFGTDYPGRNLVIKEGDTLNLGHHELSFIAAPMVHWPEVMLAYDCTDKVLFSADAFGRFGAPADRSLDAASPEYEAEEWISQARRYYIGIVGKQGPSVVKVLKKAEALDIRIICSLHGPVLTHDLSSYFELYAKWATYTPERSGIAICYSSVYGHTQEGVEYLVQTLKELYKDATLPGSENAEPPFIEVYDLVHCDMTEAVAACFAFDRVVLASTTYYNEVFPSMKSFINHLKDSAFQNRKVALIENGSWGPKAASYMKGMLESCPGIDYTETTVTIKSALHEESRSQLLSLAKELRSTLS